MAVAVAEGEGEEPQQLGQEALEGAEVGEEEGEEEGKEALGTLVLPPTLPPRVQALVRAVGAGEEVGVVEVQPQARVLALLQAQEMAPC